MIDPQTQGYIVVVMVFGLLFILGGAFTYDPKWREKERRKNERSN